MSSFQLFSCYVFVSLVLFYVGAFLEFVNLRREVEKKPEVKLFSVLSIILELLAFPITFFFGLLDSYRMNSLVDMGLLLSRKDVDAKREDSPNHNACMDGFRSGFQAGFSHAKKKFHPEENPPRYTESEYQRYGQDRADAVFKELFAGQTNPFTGKPVNTEQDYREYQKKMQERNEGPHEP